MLPTTLSLLKDKTIKISEGIKKELKEELDRHAKELTSSVIHGTQCTSTISQSLFYFSSREMLDIAKIAGDPKAQAEWDKNYGLTICKP